MRWQVIIPVKGTIHSKSRLNASSELATAIAADTVKAALGAAPVVVVTSREAAPVFSDLGAAVVQDCGGGLNAAVLSGLKSARPGPVAVLLGDLPALSGEELTFALDKALWHPRALVADAKGRGTTLLTALDGRDLLPMFGPNSRASHLAAGYAEIAVDSDAGLRLDVDTMDDLLFLTDAGRLGPETRSVLSGSQQLCQSAAHHVMRRRPSFAQ